jgi:hypothetical protein
MIHGIVGNFLWILNAGSTTTAALGDWGVLLGWVLGFFILIVAILLMNLKLDNAEDQVS